VRKLKALRRTPWLIALVVGVLALAAAAVQAAPAIMTITPKHAQKGQRTRPEHR